MSSSNEEVHRLLGEIIATNRAIQEDIREIKGEVIPNGRERIRTVETTLNNVNRRVVVASTLVVILAPAISWMVVPPIKAALSGVFM